MNDERVTLAQELHDGIAQDLVALGYSIDALISQAHEVELKSALRELRFTSSKLVDKVRNEIHSLRNDDEPLIGTTDTNLTYELQRVFLEAVRNVQEHSQATELHIEICDNGIGGAHIKDGRFGLAGILERIEKLNGEIHIESAEQGTKIRIHIPLDR